LGTDLDVCLECHKGWERIPTGEAFRVDGELLSFKVMCDNCAFRKGSPERADRLRWGELQQTLARGGEFYCHKGVPLKASIEEIAAGAPDSRMAFDFPQEVKTVDIAGEAHPYPSYQREHMRMCRGWLQTFISPLLKGDSKCRNSALPSARDN
jgi:hypothetical protein